VGIFLDVDRLLIRVTEKQHLDTEEVNYFQALLVYFQFQ
jgi:hypothetical protein